MNKYIFLLFVKRFFKHRCYRVTPCKSEGFDSVKYLMNKLRNESFSGADFWNHAKIKKLVKS